MVSPVPITTVNDDVLVGTSAATAMYAPWRSVSVIVEVSGELSVSTT